MTKAERRALEADPPKFARPKRYPKRIQSEMVDTHVPMRTLYIKAYRQAEEDLALTVDDIELIDQIMLDLSNAYATGNFDYELGSNEFYEETLKRYQEFKEKKDGKE